MSEQYEIRRLFSQSSHYVTGTVLVTLSHLLTFPIFTRIFSVADYGLLSLVTVSLSTALAVAKFGLSTSSIRFYEECKTAESPYSREQYYSTFFLSACTAGALMTLAFAGVTVLLSGIVIEPRLSKLLVFASIIVFLRSMATIVMSFLRAQQETKIYNLIETTTAYASAILSIALALVIIKGLYGFYAGQIIILSGVVVLLCRDLFKKQLIRLEHFSGRLLKESLQFGIPLVGLEFLNHVLTYGDRFFIKIFCSADALGVYSVGYNLSTYVSNIILVPISCAVTPILMKTWTQKGEEATKLFLSSSIRYVTLLLFPIVTGYIMLSEQLIVLLASQKYHDAAGIVPYVVIGTGFFALSSLSNSGLIINKRSDKILYFAALAAFLNTALNITLIPRFSIVGAALATLISYALFFVCITVSSFSLLPFRVPYKKIAQYLFCSVLMLLAISLISIKPVILNITAKIVLGIFFYSFLVLLLDSELRSRAKQALYARI